MQRLTAEWGNITDMSDDLSQPNNTAVQRAIWALLLLVPVPTVSVLMALVIAPGPIGQTIFFVGKIWLLLFPVCWWLFVEKKKIQFAKPSPASLGVGLLSGIVIAAIMFGAYYAFGHHWISAEQVRSKAEESGLSVLAVYIPMALYWCIINALIEEYVWRWFVYEKCAAIMKPVAAVIASAFFFTVHHIIAIHVQMGWQITILGSLGVFVGGCIWSALRAKYGTIWPGYISHICADIPIFFIGYMLIFGQTA